MRKAIQTPRITPIITSTQPKSTQPNPTQPFKDKKLTSWSETDTYSNIGSEVSDQKPNGSNIFDNGISHNITILHSKVSHDNKSISPESKLDLKSPPPSSHPKPPKMGKLNHLHPQPKKDSISELLEKITPRQSKKAKASTLTYTPPQNPIYHHHHLISKTTLRPS